MKICQRIGFATGLVALLIGAWYFFVLPWPARVYYWNSAALQRTADTLIQNPPEQEIADPHLPDGLQGTEITRIKMLEGCVVFSLATWPTEPSVELIYTPDGYRKLPVSGLRGPYNSFLELRRIGRSGKWFYWVRN